MRCRVSSPFKGLGEGSGAYFCVPGVMAPTGRCVSRRVFIRHMPCWLLRWHTGLPATALPLQVSLCGHTMLACGCAARCDGRGKSSRPGCHQGLSLRWVVCAALRPSLLLLLAALLRAACTCRAVMVAAAQAGCERRVGLACVHRVSASFARQYSRGKFFVWLALLQSVRVLCSEGLQRAGHPLQVFM